VCYVTVDADQAEQNLALWERDLALWEAIHCWLATRRDDLVLGALAAGVSKMRVYELTGIARTTIDRIAKGNSAQ
jgi:hypothetical protein